MSDTPDTQFPLLPRGLVIAAPGSGSGKTTLTLGLLRALPRIGVAVGNAKNGPDYIDPAFHWAASGRPSINLNSWAMPPDLIGGLATQAGADCEFVICEGSMGLFDGVPGHPGRTGAAADIAAALGWPVILIVDVGGQSQSAAAVVKGFATYDSRIKIAGVVLNRLGGPRHALPIISAIEGLGIPVLGRMPRSEKIILPERHLGLLQAEETGDLDARLDRIADFVAEHVDVAAIAALAGSSSVRSEPCSQRTIDPPGQRIAIARDTAFSFLYPHLLQSWRTAGAELRFFSPLADEAPDDACDIGWLPGGYPELHAGALANAHRFLDGLRRFAATKPIHGECGGYMVLGQMLRDADGTAHPMAGLLGMSTSFAQRKLHLGYRNATVIADSCFGPAGTALRGHEFHYASVESLGDDAPFASVTDAYGSAPAPTGSRRGHVSGSFFHVIAAA